MSLRVLTVALLLAGSVAAHAQQGVKLEFNGGLVSLAVQNAPVRVVLAEWARLGGATIVNGDRLAGPPLTLELTNVTERQALDTLLRSAAGYVLAPRRAGTTGVSAFDRIMILPTSVGPRNPAPAAATGPRPLVAPRPPVIGVPPGDDVAADEPENAPAPAAVGVPRPLVPPVVAPGQPGDREPAAEEGAPSDAERPAGVTPTPANPFGVPFGSSTLPGVVTPAPAPRPSPQTPQGR